MYIFSFIYSHKVYKLNWFFVWIPDMLRCNLFTKNSIYFPNIRHHFPRQTWSTSWNQFWTVFFFIFVSFVTSTSAIYNSHKFTKFHLLFKKWKCNKYEFCKGYKMHLSKTRALNEITKDFCLHQSFYCLFN